MTTEPDSAIGKAADTLNEVINEIEDALYEEGLTMPAAMPIAVGVELRWGKFKGEYHLIVATGEEEKRLVDSPLATRIAVIPLLPALRAKAIEANKSLGAELRDAIAEGRKLLAEMEKAAVGG